MSNNSYVERDITALRNKLIQKVKEETSTWTDFNESDIGMVFIEVLAGCVDFCNYYLDKQVNELYLDRAEEPKNIRSILNTMNYRIPFKKAAEGSVRFINPERLITNDVVIPKYTELSTSQGEILRVVTKEERVLIGGEELIEVPVIQGTKKEVHVTVQRLKRNWKYVLEATSLADKSVRVIDSEGEWEEVDDAFLKYDGGRYFSVHTDAKDNVYILFTWNWETLLPKDESELVTIQYVETLGDKGRINEFNVNTLLDKLYDVDGNDVTKALIVNNPGAISGGTADPDTYKMITDAKNQVKTMGKLVTLSDYANAAAAYNGVYKSVTQDWSSPSHAVTKAYEVDSWIVSDTGEPFSKSFLATMSKDIADSGVVIIDYSALQAEIVRFNVSAQIKIRSEDEEFRANLRRKVIENLQEVYGYGKMEFGQSVTWDDIRNYIKQTHSSITEVIMVEPLNNIIIDPVQYPALGSVDIEVVGDYYGL